MICSCKIHQALSRGVSPDLIPGLAVLGLFDVEPVELVCSREGCGTVITTGCGHGEDADLCRMCDWKQEAAARIQWMTAWSMLWFRVGMERRVEAMRGAA